MTSTPKWHDIYKAALLETDWSRRTEAAAWSRKKEKDAS